MSACPSSTASVQTPVLPQEHGGLQARASFRLTTSQANYPVSHGEATHSASGGQLVLNTCPKGHLFPPPTFLLTQRDLQTHIISKSQSVQAGLECDTSRETPSATAFRVRVEMCVCELV